MSNHEDKWATRTEAALADIHYLTTEIMGVSQDKEVVGRFDPKVLWSLVVEMRETVARIGEAARLSHEHDMTVLGRKLGEGTKAHGMIATSTVILPQGYGMAEAVLSGIEDATGYRWTMAVNGDLLTFTRGEEVADGDT